MKRKITTILMEYEKVSHKITVIFLSKPRITAWKDKEILTKRQIGGKGTNIRRSTFSIRSTYLHLHFYRTYIRKLVVQIKPVIQIKCDSFYTPCARTSIFPTIQPVAAIWLLSGASKWIL
jgi:hypothetical protein